MIRRFLFLLALAGAGRCAVRSVEIAEAAFIALDPAGRTGAACTPGTDFYYAVGRGSAVEVCKCDAIPSPAF